MRSIWRQAVSARTGATANIPIRSAAGTILGIAFSFHCSAGCWHHNKAVIPAKAGEGRKNGGDMKAALCTHYGPPEELELSEVPAPAPGKGQVLVSVKSCGVNFPDVLLIQDKYQFKPPLPFAPGGEVAGIVKDTGEDVTNVRPEDRVAVSIGSGGFAEEIVADARRCLVVPE